MKNIEAVTFDAGGTLIEPWPSVGEVYASVAREFGIDCSAARLNAQFVNAWTTRSGFEYSRAEWHDVVRHSFLGISDVSPQLFDAIYDRFAQSDAWLIYDDVIPSLQMLEAAGLKLAVISNWDDRLIPLLEKLGLATYFDHIVVSAEHGAHKPDACIFQHAADLLGVAPNDMLHIGDSLREDVAGAEAAGASALRIRRSSPSPLGGERAGVRSLSGSDIQSLTLIPGIIDLPTAFREKALDCGELPKE
ncbi:MAG: HAD-IA family hydrolase [Limisphaerales bacterium]